MDVFKYLSDMVASIKRLGSILAGDEVGDGWSWQRVALYQAHEMRHYAAVLERIAAGKHGGGVVFPSWDAEGVDGVDSPVPPEEIGGVPKSGFMPEWTAGLRADCEQRGDIIMRMDDRVANMRAKAWELQRSYSQAKAALAAAAVALREGADTLARYGNETGKPMVCVAVEARLRTVADLATATIEGARRES